jgi:hypothetical protein
MFKGTLLPAIIEKISTLKDGSVSLTIYTQELSPQKAAELFTLRGKLATVYLSPSEISSKELSLVDSIEPDMPGKSPSQRMRNVLWILFKQDSEGYEDFPHYYERKMNTYIDSLKQNIKD